MHINLGGRGQWLQNALKCVVGGYSISLYVQAELHKKPCHLLVAHKSSPSQRGHQRCLPIIREPVMWNARQSLYRPWDACLPYVWPSRLRSGQPMLSLCRRIPGRRHLFLCASRLALCQPMSDVSFPIARPNAVRRSRCQGCSHAVGRS